MVYDCCPFMSENLLYELKVNQHWDYVDKFIVVEAGETHTGKKKSFNFDHKRFEKYKEKIVYVKFDSFEEEYKKFPWLIDPWFQSHRTGRPTEKDWFRDNFQASYYVKVLKDLGAHDDDIVYQSSVDEILKKEAWQDALKIFKNSDEYLPKSPDNHPSELRIQNWPQYRNIKTGPIFGFWMHTYAYKFNLRSVYDMPMGVISKFSTLKKILPAVLRHMAIETHPPLGSPEKNAGWHFTSFCPEKGEYLIEKQSNYAHSKDRGDWINLSREEMVARCFIDHKLKIVEITEETHPKHLVDNIEKYKEGIYQDGRL